MPSVPVSQVPAMATHGVTPGCTVCLWAGQRGCWQSLQPMNLYFWLLNIHKVIKPHFKKARLFFDGWWWWSREGREGGVNWATWAFENGMDLNFVENWSRLLWHQLMICLCGHVQTSGCHRSDVAPADQRGRRCHCLGSPAQRPSVPASRVPGWGCAHHYPD